MMLLLPAPKEMPVTYCCECGVPIYRCNGTTLAGDFVKFINGELEGRKVRQGCPRCSLRWQMVQERGEV